MPNERYDLVVIGAGPAGEKGAAQAAYFNKRVAVVEREPEPGGAAVHTGTLPSKTLRETALYISGYHARELYGVAVELDPQAKLPHLMSRKRAIAVAESRAFRDTFSRHRVDYVYGAARFEDAHTVLVQGANGEQRLEAEHVLIATGSAPFRPADMDFTDPHVHDSDEILTIEHLPRTLTILGAGVIGCEYACMFAALGTQVSLVDARPEILPFLDLELIARLRKAMAQIGVTLHQNTRWTGVARTGDRISTTLTNGTVLQTEDVLFCAGRFGNTAKLGLDKVGITPDARGYLQVDAEYRTSVPHILAAGDVIGFPALASVSMEQGRVAVCHAFDFAYKRAVAKLMPYGIYTIPELSSFGETEETCRQKGLQYVVGRALFANNPRGKITGDVEGMLKLLVERSSRRIVGVHVIGDGATELVHIGQAAIHLDATVDLFIDMVFNYPTLSDSYKYAAYDCLQALALAPNVS